MPAPDLSEFEQLSKPKRPPCKIGEAIRELDEGAALEAACETGSGDITHSAISEWLGRRGMEVHYNLIASHRKGTCTCADE